MSEVMLTLRQIEQDILATGKLDGHHLEVLRRPVPIVPVGVAGAFEAMPLPAWFPRLSPLFWSPTDSSIAVSVGKPIPPERYQAVGLDRLLDYLFHEVQAQVRRAERLTRKVG